MVEPLDDTWQRDLKVLTELARRVEAGEQPYVTLIAELLGIDEQTAGRISAALEDAGYITGIHVDEMAGPIIVTSITEKARRTVGLWPTPEVAADRLLAGLDALIDRTTEPEQRGRLERTRDGLVGAGRDVVVAVAGAVLTGQIGV